MFIPGNKGYCPAYVSASLLWLVLVLPLCVAYAADVQPPVQGNGQKQINLNNVPLKDFIQFVGRYTGKNMVFREDQLPGTKVTITSAQSMTEDEILAIFNEVLSGSGLEAVARGDVVYISPPDKAGKVDSAFKPDRTPGKAGELTTTVFQLGGDITPKQAVALLSGMVSNVGKVQEIPQAGAVLVQDRTERIRKMRGVLDNIKAVKPRWETKMFILRKAKADLAAARLKEYFAHVNERGQMVDLPLVLPLDWSNSLFVSAPRDNMPTIAKIIHQIDDQGANAPSGFKVYNLRNANAQQIAEIIKNLAVQKQNQRIQIAASNSTNSIIVTGEPDFVAGLDEVIAKLDVPRDQVYVEALIMETTLENSQKFGVEWFVGGGSKDMAASGGFVNRPSDLFAYQKPVLENESPNFSVLPGGFTLGLLGNVITYAGVRYPTMSALINFLKGMSGIEILATPQIMTMDNNEAEIFVGENRPFMTGQRYDTASTTNAVPLITYDYRDVGIKLKVTPHVIREEKSIRLQIDQEVKNVKRGEGRYDSPVTMNRNTRTQVQILDGSTMVISGLVENDSELGRKAVPGLSQIPLLGWLFKNQDDTFKKVTLMVFITARIVRSGDQAFILSQGKRQETESLSQKSRDFVEQEFSGMPAKSDFQKALEDSQRNKTSAAPMQTNSTAVPKEKPLGQ